MTKDLIDWQLQTVFCAVFFSYSRINLSLS